MLTLLDPPDQVVSHHREGGAIGKPVVAASSPGSEGPGTALLSRVVFLGLAQRLTWKLCIRWKENTFYACLVSI